MNTVNNNAIKALQRASLDITLEIVRTCEKYGIEYFIISGTMLGAVRHKGFIPWDDDIDIGMKRDHYEAFLRVAQSELPENLKLITYKNTPEYHYYISRVVDTETTVEEIRMSDKEKTTHVAVDVCPIDGCPNNLFIRKLYFLRVMYHRALMSLCYKDSIDKERKRGLPEKVLLYVMKMIPIEKMTTPHKQKEIIDRLLKSNDVYHSLYIGQLMAAYRTKEMIPEKCYGDGAYYSFEGYKLRGPQRYHSYLTWTYGDDYMRLPPKEAQRNHYRPIRIHGECFAEGGEK